MPKTKGRTFITIGASALFCGFTIWAITQWHSPPLHLTIQGSDAVFNMQTLGEYQTTINRIRVRESKTNSIIWEVTAEGGITQISTISLRLGINPSLPKAVYGHYRVLTPTSQDSFSLRNDIEYIFEAWGESSKYFRSSCAFEF